MLYFTLQTVGYNNIGWDFINFPFEFNEMFFDLFVKLWFKFYWWFVDWALWYLTSGFYGVYVNFFLDKN